MANIDDLLALADEESWEYVTAYQRINRTPNFDPVPIENSIISDEVRN